MNLQHIHSSINYTPEVAALLLGSTTTLVNSHHCHLGQRIDQVYHKGMYYYYLCMNSLIELLFEEMSGDVLQAISFCDDDDYVIGLGEG